MASNKQTLTVPHVYDYFVLPDGAEIQLILVGDAPHVDKLKDYVLASDLDTLVRVRNIIRCHLKRSSMPWRNKQAS